MSWATRYIEQLKQGLTVQFRPRGNSMTPRIKSGQLCTVAPIDTQAPPQVDDVVLCKVKGAQYLHIVKAVQGDRYLIGNAHGRINGWVGHACVYGKLLSVHD
jgi:hypothetical protein